MAKIIASIFQAIFVAGGILDSEQAQLLAAITDEILSLTIVISILTFSFSVPLLMRTIHRKVEASKNSTVWAFLAQVADQAVLSAEQTIASGDNAMKYDYASKILSDISNSHGIKTATPDVCRVLIEAAVYNLKMLRQK